MFDRQSMQAAVDEVVGSDPGVELAAIASHDGLVMFSSSQEQDLNDVIGAMTSEVLAKAKQTCRELDFGAHLAELVLGRDGGLMVRGINDEMVLVAKMRASVNVGRVFGVLSQVAARIARL